MTNPFNNIKTQSIVSDSISLTNQIKENPLAKVQYNTISQPKRIAITEKDVDSLGNDLSNQIGQTTEKIISKMGIGSFDELGKILVNVQSEVNSLDPSKVRRKGILGLWQKAFGDIKKELTLRMSKADEVFTKLGGQINNHITVHKEWIKDLESLYNENYSRYNSVVKIIEQADEWLESVKYSLDNWEPIDENDKDAYMKAQAKRDAESLYNRLQIKRDSFLRLKALTENNAPKIRSQQDTSRTTIQSLGIILTETIPMIKWEFALFKQSIDSQKSIQIVDNAKNLANQTLVRSADSAKDAAIAASRALNSPVIDNSTLVHIKSRMLETLTEVRNIETTARTQREQDAKMINDGQKDYLNKLMEFK